MRLLTHNMMCCIKCKQYPLGVEATEISLREQTTDLPFVQNMLGRVEYPVLIAIVDMLRAQQPETMGCIPPLPPTVADINFADESHVMAVHIALTAILIKNGALTCGACNARFPIVDFIPNMMAEQ